MSNDHKNDADTVVIDGGDDQRGPGAPTTTDGLNPVGPRTTTNELEPLSKPLRVELDLDDPRALAEFLEHVARTIRERKRVIITIE